MGNLQSVTYPNGVVHAYGYDTRNRLTNLGVNGTVSGAPAPIASHAYTLDAAGHRIGVTELSGRTVSYGYDNIYRLTSETIASDPAAMNGAVSYTYDAAGNRTQKVSSLPGYPGGPSNYNANDQLTTDTYDGNGNTTMSNALGYAYDFENHLIQQGGISIVYDGDGNRVSKTVAGLTTTYLVDPFSIAGYAQVVYESFSDNSTGNRELNHAYVYGLERISERRSYVANNQNPTTNAYYVYDGHGSVRALADSGGAVTDTYDYDAFGNLIHSTGASRTITSSPANSSTPISTSTTTALGISTSPPDGSGQWTPTRAETWSHFLCTNISTHQLIQWTALTRAATKTLLRFQLVARLGILSTTLPRSKVRPSWTRSNMAGVLGSRVFSLQERF